MRGYPSRMPKQTSASSSPETGGSGTRDTPVAADSPVSRVNASNLHGLDYAALARELGPPVAPIIDAHAHIIGTDAVDLYREVADLFGVEIVYSMTPWEAVEPVRERLGSRVRFIAVPDFRSDDRKHAHGDGFLERIEQFHGIGSRMVKFWTAPRSIDLAEEGGAPGLMKLDSPQRREQMKLADSLDMLLMAHIADPDTWFSTKYADASRYGTKADQYVPLERLLDEFTRPWLIAHMGGWPEDLDFLDGLLERHPNVHLDCSACKWMVRELSRHDSSRIREFFDRWRGRILYGSDIVTVDSHLSPSDDGVHEMDRKASGRREAFDLYASRYWAYRTMFERTGDRPSPIADPDLAMVDPDSFDANASPTLRGHGFDDDLRRVLYRESAAAMLESRFCDLAPNR